MATYWTLTNNHMRIYSVKNIKRLVLLSSILLISACRTSPTLANETPDETPYTVRNKITTMVPPKVHSHTLHPSQPLTAHPWQLKQAKDANGQRIDALFVDENRPLTVEFRHGNMPHGNIHIRNTCNAMNGTYTVDTANDSLTIGALMGTMMACPKPLMALDRAITLRLEGTLHIISIENNELHIQNEAGDVLVFKE